MKLLLPFLMLFSAYAFAAIDIDATWDWDHPEVSEEIFARLAEANLHDTEMYLQLRTQVARAQGLQSEFVKAHQTLDEVYQFLNASTPIAEIRYNLERGRVFNSSEHPSEAMPYFERALRNAKSAHNDILAIDAAHMLGLAEPDLDKELEWDNQALALIAASKDPKARGWYIPVKMNMGNTYEDKKDYQSALDAFEEVADLMRKAGEAPSPDILKEIEMLKGMIGKS